MSIGNKLKNYRNKIGYTQEHVSEKINVSRQTISNWENGKTLPDIYSLILLANLYDISLDNLLREDTNMIKNLKSNKNTFKTIKLSVIFGTIGILILMSSFCVSNEHISKFLFGTGIGTMSGSIVTMIISIIGNYIQNKKNAKN